MKKVIVYPHHMRDSTAKRFAEYFGTKRVYPDGNYKYKDNHVILNWGNSYYPSWYIEGSAHSFCNTPRAVGGAIDKFNALLMFNDWDIPAPQVYKWPINNENTFYALLDELLYYYKEHPLFLARTMNGSFGGKGIVPVWHCSDIPQNTKFLSRYIPKDREYRVHVFNGKVIAVQQKRKRRGEKRDPYIWNAHTGSVLVVNNVQEIPPEHFDKCIKAVQILELDFGAVDLGYNSNTDTSVVYEVNTAPCIRGKKVFDAYITAIEEILK